MSPELKIYDKLLQFPLFQGMSYAELMQVVAHTKMGFMKTEADRRIVREGTPCTHLYFLISGTMSAETEADDHSYSVEETITAPYLIQPERLFGMYQRYSSTFKTTSACHFITIDKQEVMLLLETQMTFRINMLTLLATNVQRLGHQPWRQAPGSLRLRMTRFFIQHCLRPAGHKVFRITMQRLADELNCHRVHVSQTLADMQAGGLVNVSRGRIIIPSLEQLLM
ncbi:MAG: Crp/Fnr family transcriptional regulator [Prevotella sp.]|nr:Crp/Fnr family transcriptional regulator [Prevotella sp.]